MLDGSFLSGNNVYNNNNSLSKNWHIYSKASFMVLKMVGNLECDRRDMFSELSIRVQNILLPSYSPKKKKKERNDCKSYSCSTVLLPL